MEYTDAIKRTIEESLIELESEIKNSVIRTGNEREEIFTYVRKKLEELYEMLPSIFRQSIKKLDDLTNTVERCFRQR